jgi:hypothetical protein
MKLGGFVELLIKIITFGQGHRIALFIAKEWVMMIVDVKQEKTS